MTERTSPDEEHGVERDQSDTADAAPARRNAVGAEAAAVQAAARAAARTRDVKRPARRANRPLPVAREAFVATIARDTAGADGPRLVKVLDALIAWSVAHPARLTFRVDEQRGNVLAFALASTGVVFWSATASRGVSPKLEIFPPAGLPRTAEDRAAVLETLNAHSRDVLIDGDRLRIGFGALKNDAARAAVLALMTQLLAHVGEPTE